MKALILKLKEELEHIEECVGDPDLDKTEVMEQMDQMSKDFDDFKEQVDFLVGKEDFFDWEWIKGSPSPVLASEFFSLIIRQASKTEVDGWNCIVLMTFFSAICIRRDRVAISQGFWKSETKVKHKMATLRNL